MELITDIYEFEYSKDIDQHILISLANSYDFYVSMRELDYSDGVKDNDTIYINI